jgi:four helix bundle protein
MTETQNRKHYDLEERTFAFARGVARFLHSSTRTLANTEYAKQLIRSSGSVGANYIEANEALSKKDFVLRIKICRKEAKESCYWLRLLELPAPDTEERRGLLVGEATELMKIFGAILQKAQ